MKKLVWLSGLILLASFVVPYIPAVPSVPAPVTDPAAAVPADATIVKILQPATAADRSRVRGVYTALATILKRDNGKRITTTAQWEEWAANTLQLAIETPGKYAGLDVAIENVFKRVVGTDDVLPNNADTRAKLIEACDIIVSSAK